MSTRLVDLSLREFADRLSARTPTPGGGSVAAYLTAAGAGLAAMAFRFTSGEKYAAVETAMARRVEALEAMRARGLALVDLDSASYEAVTAAYKLPKTSDTEKSARAAAVQRALHGALEVPAETLEVAAAALRLLSEGLPEVNPNLASDAASGALCLWSAGEAALMNVKINAASITDKAWSAERLRVCDTLRRDAQSFFDACRAAADTKLGA